MAEKTKPSRRENLQNAIESLKHGGRGDLRSLHEIADMNIAELLSSGLTLEQAETVLRMAVIEISRVVEEARMRPKAPAVEIKIKRGKK